MDHIVLPGASMSSSSSMKRDILQLPQELLAISSTAHRAHNSWMLQNEVYTDTNMKTIKRISATFNDLIQKCNNGLRI